jgi:hypothetical protein
LQANFFVNRRPQLQVSQVNTLTDTAEVVQYFDLQLQLRQSCQAPRELLGC